MTDNVITKLHQCKHENERNPTNDSHNDDDGDTKHKSIMLLWLVERNMQV